LPSLDRARRDGHHDRTAMLSTWYWDSEEEELVEDPDEEASRLTIQTYSHTIKREDSSHTVIVDFQIGAP